MAIERLTPSTPSLNIHDRMVREQPGQNQAIPPVANVPGGSNAALAEYAVSTALVLLRMAVAALGAATVILGLMFAMARLRVKSLPLYLLMFAFLWYAMLLSGVHCSGT